MTRHTRYTLLALLALLATTAAVLEVRAQKFGDRFIRVTFDHCVVAAGAGGDPDAPPICGFATADGYTVLEFPESLELYERLTRALATELARPPPPAHSEHVQATPTHPRGL